MLETRGETTINASTEDVMAVIANFEDYPHWVDYLAFAEVLSEAAPLPFPIEWSGRRWTATCSPASLGRGVVLGLCGR